VSAGIQASGPPRVEHPDADRLHETGGDDEARREPRAQEIAHAAPLEEPEHEAPDHAEREPVHHHAHGPVRRGQEPEQDEPHLGHGDAGDDGEGPALAGDLGHDLDADELRHEVAEHLREHVEGLHVEREAPEE
jgi:hypothetical protein